MPKEIFNAAQIESEQLAKIATRLIPETWSGEVEQFGDLVGVLKDGVFYTATIDGVGTKLEIAAKLNSFYELGIDVVNSQINDLIRFGIEPKFFLSMISAASQNEEQMEELAKGQVAAAKNVGVPIIGGETEILKDILFKAEDKLNVAVSAFGWERLDKLITREGIEAGDGLFALPSFGIHNNGFSEIVKRFSEIEFEETLFDLSSDSDQTVEGWLKKPTVNYLEDFRLLKQAGVEVKAAEAVTGGGFAGRLAKLLENTKLQAVIDPLQWGIPPILEYLKWQFGWSDEQMQATFNMGVGMFLVIAQKDCQKAIEVIKTSRRKISQIGFLG